MNFNNRSDYLQGLLAALDGLSYYINDFNSTGILYYDVGDLYNVQIGENTYQCLMLNDEITVTTGIEERIYTDLPEQSQTDYSKADKTDRRINQTYLIVDKQNQTIESVVSNVSSQNSKISQITQTVDELNSKIQDIADITKAEESNNAVVTLTDINESEPIMIKVHPTGNRSDLSISYIYPSNYVVYPNRLVDLFDYNLTAYMKNRIIRFKRTYEEDGQTLTENIDYEIPDDLIYHNSTHYDEFYLDYDSQTCQIIKRCKYDEYYNVEDLENEVVTDYPYPQILLGDGDYEISLPGYEAGYLFVRLMAQNIYTTQFATNAQLTSAINQTAEEIDLSVNQKLTNYSTTNEMNSAINIKADQITSTVSQNYATKNETNNLSSRIKQTAKSIELTTTDNGTSAGITIRVRNEDGTQIDSDSGNITLSGLVKFTDLSRSGSTTINGSNITTGTIDASQVNVTNINANNIESGTISGSKISGGTIDGDKVTIKNLDASKITTGTLSASKISGGTLNADNMTVKNLTADSIKSKTLNGISLNSSSISGTSISGGSLSNTPYSFSGSSSDTVSISSSTSGTIEGYYGSKSSSNRRYSLKAFTSGGRFQSFNSSGGQACYFDHNGAHDPSDIRLKNNISNIEQQKSMNIINNLTPIEFTYKADETEYHRGLSAQEVEQVLKNNGIENEIFEIRENGEYALKYTELIPDLINCIKYLTKEIEKLKGGNK